MVKRSRPSMVADTKRGYEVARSGPTSKLKFYCNLISCHYFYVGELRMYIKLHSFHWYLGTSIESVLSFSGSTGRSSIARFLHLARVCPCVTPGPLPSPSSHGVLTCLVILSNPRLGSMCQVMHCLLLCLRDDVTTESWSLDSRVYKAASSQLGNSGHGVGI